MTALRLEDLPPLPTPHASNDVWAEMINAFLPALVTAVNDRLTTPVAGSGAQVNLFDPQFGVKGDGVADDSVAVQAFFDYLGAHGGQGIAIHPLIGKAIFKLTANILIYNPAMPFTFTGNGVTGTTFLGAHPTSTNMLTVNDAVGCTFRGFTLDGGSATTTHHGVSCNRSSDMTYSDITVRNYSGVAIFCASLTTEPLVRRNHIVRCTAQGGGTAIDGFLHANAVGSTIDNCQVFALSLTGSPGYGLQLKNNCQGCAIIGGYVDTAIAGVAFGTDTAGTKASGNIVTGVVTRNCVYGLFGNNMESNSVDLTVLMLSSSACRGAVRLAAESRDNGVRVRVSSPDATASVVRIQEDGNRVHVETLDTLGSARPAQFEATSAANLVVVGQIGDVDDSALADVDVLNDGASSNKVIFERAGSTSGTSGGGVPTPPPPVAPYTPAQILNLGSQPGQNHFKVQLARDGASAYEEHLLPELEDGFELPPYLDVTSDNWVQLKVSVGAPTTSGSHYARAELRELAQDGSNMAFNPRTGHHFIQDQIVIDHQPAGKPEIVVMQLHDGNRDRIAIRTQAISSSNPTVTAISVRVNGTTGSHTTSASGVTTNGYHETTAYVTGRILTLRIDGLNDVWKVYIDNLSTPVVTVPAGGLDTTSTACYLKTGNYLQSQVDVDDPGTEYGLVRVRGLLHGHPGWPANQPIPQFT